jgi:hypothetical protein
MSLLILKDDLAITLFNNILVNDSKTKEKQLTFHHITLLNGCDECHVCNGGVTMDCDTHLIQPLIKHHVRYFPQIIAYVHFECHKKIHDIKNPIISLIQYEEGDSTKFYNLKKQQVMEGMTA